MLGRYRSVTQDYTCLQVSFKPYTRTVRILQVEYMKVMLINVRWYAFLTDLPLRYGFSTGKIWKLAEQSHQRYGPIVRLGPRQVWVSDREAMKQILIMIDLPKVAMYAEISRDRCSPGLFGEMYARRRFWGQS